MKMAFENLLVASGKDSPIARAFLNDDHAHLAILDEPTAAIDPRPVSLKFINILPS